MLRIFIETSSKLYRCSSKELIICLSIMVLEFSRKISKVFSNAKLNDIPSSWIRVIPKSNRKQGNGECNLQLTRLNLTYFLVNSSASWTFLQWEFEDCA